MAMQDWTVTGASGVSDAAPRQLLRGATATHRWAVALIGGTTTFWFVAYVIASLDLGPRVGASLAGLLAGAMVTGRLVGAERSITWIQAAAALVATVLAIGVALVGLFFLASR